MNWIFWIWLSGFVLCALFSAIQLFRVGKFSLEDIFEYLPVCVASWVTIICDTCSYFFVGDIIIWSRDDENKE